MNKRDPGRDPGAAFAMRVSRAATVCMSVVLVLAGVAGIARAQAASSLWLAGGQSLFADRRASSVGDLLTVLIVERSYASNRAQTATGKGAGVTLVEGVGVFSFLPETGFSASTKSNGQASTTRSGDLVAKMTARVAEVLPGGNLRIEGTQALVINRERQNITITGVIRPEDIAADNTVLSTYIADAEIRYDGALDVDQKKGLLSYLQRFFGGILDFLF